MSWNQTTWKALLSGMSGSPNSLLHSAYSEKQHHPGRGKIFSTRSIVSFEGVRREQRFGGAAFWFCSPPDSPSSHWSNKVLIFFIFLISSLLILNPISIIISDKITKFTQIILFNHQNPAESPSIFDGGGLNISSAGLDQHVTYKTLLPQNTQPTERSKLYHTSYLSFFSTVTIFC